MLEGICGCHTHTVQTQERRMGGGEKQQLRESPRKECVCVCVGGWLVGVSELVVVDEGPLKNGLTVIHKGGWK